MMGQFSETVRSFLKEKQLLCIVPYRLIAIQPISHKEIMVSRNNDLHLAILLSLHHKMYVRTNAMEFQIKKNSQINSMPYFYWVMFAQHRMVLIRNAPTHKKGDYLLGSLRCGLMNFNYYNAISESKVLIVSF